MTEEEEQIKMENVLTFTTIEINKVADFINEMYVKATFNNVTGRDIQRLNAMFVGMHEHKNKLDRHVFEITKVMQSPKKEESK